GTPQQVFEHPELLELLLPTIRADFALADSYAYAPKPPLDGPIVALGGRVDALVGVADLDAWHEYTTGHFARHLFEGDHFFLFTGSAAVARVLAGHLTRP